MCGRTGKKAGASVKRNAQKYPEPQKKRDSGYFFTNETPQHPLPKRCRERGRFGHWETRSPSGIGKAGQAQRQEDAGRSKCSVFGAILGKYRIFRLIKCGKGRRFFTCVGQAPQQKAALSGNFSPVISLPHHGCKLCPHPDILHQTENPDRVHNPGQHHFAMQTHKDK
mgnify:CR=1 FL=1